MPSPLPCVRAILVVRWREAKVTEADAWASMWWQVFTLGNMAQLDNAKVRSLYPFRRRKFPFRRSPKGAGHEDLSPETPLEPPHDHE